MRFITFRGVLLVIGLVVIVISVAIAMAMDRLADPLIHPAGRS